MQITISPSPIADQSAHDVHAFDVSSDKGGFLFTLVITYDANGRQSIALQGAPWSGEWGREPAENMQIATAVIAELWERTVEDDEVPLTSTIERLKSVTFDFV